MATIVTPMNNDPFRVEGGKNGSIRVLTKVGSNFNGQTLKLEMKDPTSNDWYDTGVSFNAVNAAVVAVPFTGTYRFTGTFTGVAASFMFI